MREKARKKASADDEPVDTALRSEGQRLLLCAPYTLGQIASALGVSKQVVSYWRTGKQAPGLQARMRLQGALGIASDTWGQEARADEVRPLPAPPELTPAATPLWAPARPMAALPSSVVLPVASGPSTTMEGVEALLVVVREARGRDGLLAAERVKLADAETRLLALRHRMERETELVEDRIVRLHPKWNQIKVAIAAAVVRWPEAARAVAAALQELDP